ncbi:MAG: hypothetical protein FWG64_08380 [Firmicutes bacterium]|nr:hypothetical protein [Bacillota bacterium]
MRTEKITINLSSAEVAQIDFLVAKGLYVNRADCIRLSIREKVESHKANFDEFLQVADSNSETTANLGFFGIATTSKFDLETYANTGKKLVVKGVGVFNVPKDVTVQLLAATLADFKVYGKIVASEEIKEFLKVKFEN